MRSLLRSAGLSLLLGWLLVASLVVRASAAEPAPGSFTGKGFDACTAPTSAAMDAWLASPYRAVGVYIGGNNRACTQPQLTASWVAHQQATGWHLLPIYLGLQAPCTTSNKKHLIDPVQAATQGRAEADAAVVAAGALGLPPGSILIFDMEAYAADNPPCTATVLTFLGAWTARLHDRGYFSAVYGSLASTVRDLVEDYHSTRRPRPDYLYFARYDGIADTTNPAIPISSWSGHRRIHQYRGGHNETYAGVTINIDNDYVDIRPLPRPSFNDFNGNGWTDLLAREAGSGDVYLYPGNGTNLGGRSKIAGRWTDAFAITRWGDFDGDRRDDLIVRTNTTGELWLYPGTGAGLATRVRLATGWNSRWETTAVGDLTADGNPDLVARDQASGFLYLYPGRGRSLGTRVSLGPDWNTMSELTGIGDLTGDRRPDLLARHTGSGTLYLYPGNGSGLGPRISLGGGWSNYRNLVGVGDFDRNGYPDLMAVGSSTGNLYLFAGRKDGLQSRIILSHGTWGGRSPLF
ncbi:glycoside hydrolase domain-containing protein [Microlunatus soli]|uniref:Repeat domain-containing protein n=1 Tax=Microlunatus soli TaxID=630515 RepID=A0A1H1ZS20_9ACTN|nr:glycoside hydrolase domain-containing protein [Microlunatus soli]SDT36450.1 Repeat domain-containing protein [Microlunatus soli]